MPIYFEIGLYPFYAGFAAAAFLFTLRAISLVFRLPAIGSEITKSQWRPAIARLASIAFCVGPIALIAWSHGEPWRTGYRYPPERSEIIAALERSIGLTPGGRFNGYVAPYLGFKDLPPGDPAMNPYIDVEVPLSVATGNDHRTVGLWYYNIPGLVEISSAATPPFFLFGTENSGEARRSTIQARCQVHEGRHSTASSDRRSIHRCRLPDRCACATSPHHVDQQHKI